MISVDLYEHDFYGWITENIALIKAQRFTEVDFEHITEELDSMGKREQRELYNRLAVLVAHLLKWQYQPERQGSSWEKTIKIQRLDAQKVLKTNPSFKHDLVDVLAESYEKGRLIAEKETHLAIFPATCPYTIAQVLDNDFYPAS